MEMKHTALVLALMGFNLQGVALAAQDDPATVVVKALKRVRPPAGEAPPPVEAFTKNHRFEAAAVSPDGDKAAFIARFGEEGDQTRHVLVVYDAGADTHKEIELDKTPYDGLYWVDDKMVALSRSASGRKSTCPDLDGGTGRRIDKLMALVAAENAINMMAKPEDAAAFRRNLNPLKCTDYGVRRYAITATVNVETAAVAFIGSKMGENRQLGTDTLRPVRDRDAAFLMGAFVDLNPKLGGGVFSERVYLWKVDPATGQGSIVDDRGGDLDRTRRYVDDWLFDRTGRILARSYYDLATESYVVQGHEAGRWKTLLTTRRNARDGVIAPFLAGLGRDGKSILVVMPDPGKNADYHYRELSPTGQLSSPVDVNGATRDTPIFDSDGRLAGFMTHGIRPEYRLFSPGMQKVYDAVQDFAPEDAVEVVSVAADDSRKMLLKVKGHADTGQYYYVDFSSGTYRTLGVDYPALRPEWVASTQAYTYKARDGVDLKGILTTPSRTEDDKRSLIVLPHDHPSGADTLNYHWLAQLLASRGYTVFQPNWRGSSIYPETMNKTGEGQFAGKMLEDIDDGVRALVQDRLADPSRVCLAGVGYGGYAALMLAGRSPGMYRCAIPIGAITDLEQFRQYLEVNRRITPDPRIQSRLYPGRTISLYNDDLAVYARYWQGVDMKASSPSTILPSLTAPLLFLRLSGDPSVSNSRAADPVNRLASEGVYAKYKALEGCDRSLSTETCKVEVGTEILSFLDAIRF